MIGKATPSGHLSSGASGASLLEALPLFPHSPWRDSKSPSGPQRHIFLFVFLFQLYFVITIILVQTCSHSCVDGYLFLESLLHARHRTHPWGYIIEIKRGKFPLPPSAATASQGSVWLSNLMGLSQLRPRTLCPNGLRPRLPLFLLGNVQN